MTSKNIFVQGFCSSGLIPVWRIAKPSECSIARVLLTIFGIAPAKIDDENPKMFRQFLTPSPGRSKSGETIVSHKR